MWELRDVNEKSWSEVYGEKAYFECAENVMFPHDELTHGSYNWCDVFGYIYVFLKVSNVDISKENELT